MFLALIFLLMYAPFLNILGVTIHFPYIFVISCSIVFLFLIFVKNVISKIYLTFIILYWIGGVWALTIGIFNRNIDYSILFSYFTGTLSLFAVYPVVYFLARKIKTDVVSFIIKSVYTSGLIHAVIMILAFFVAPFRSILYSIVPLGVKGESFVELMVRSPGLTSGGGDALSVIQAISLMFGTYYFVEINKKFSLINSVAFIISFIIILLSILLSARTGLVILLAFILGLIFYKLFEVLFQLKMSRGLIFKSLFVSVLFAVIIPLGYTFLIESEYTRFASRAFELYINYIETGEIGTSSSKTVQNMYFLPESTQHLLLGDGNFGREKTLPYIDSDIGYIRTIFGVGIVGSLVMFLPFAYILVVTIRNRRLSKNLSRMIILVVIVILITNFKVFHYFEFRESFRVLFLLLSTLAVLKTHSQREDVVLA